jgi:hypothetical protein
MYTTPPSPEGRINYKNHIAGFLAAFSVGTQRATLQEVIVL